MCMNIFYYMHEIFCYFTILYLFWNLLANYLKLVEKKIIFHKYIVFYIIKSSFYIISWKLINKKTET